MKLSRVLPMEDIEGERMADRAELLEATLESFPEGVALLGENYHVMFWNEAARMITGYAAVEMIGRPLPETLKPLLEGSCPAGDAEPGVCMLGTNSAFSDASHEIGRGFIVHARHKLDRNVSAMARLLVLRDGLGQRIGTAVMFHSTECLEALPHGEAGEDAAVEASQEDLKGRLESLFVDFSQGGVHFGVLWITVDQAHDLRKTHGASACESMLKKIEHTLAQGLRPGEHLGRWGNDELLVISHEATQSMLSAHAQVLAGLARTANFRWWGDRVSLTISIGAAQAESSGTLADLLERAKTSMLTSYHAGGNQITPAPEEHSCLPS
jgi:diguanylate cyclase (GGDEF)-like protein